MSETNNKGRANPKRPDSCLLIKEHYCPVLPSLEEILNPGVARLIQQLWFWAHNPYKSRRLGAMDTKWYFGRLYVKVPHAWFYAPFKGAFRSSAKITIDRYIAQARKQGVLRVEKFKGNENWFCVYHDHIDLLNQVKGTFEKAYDAEWEASINDPKAKVPGIPAKREKAILDNYKRHLTEAKSQCVTRIANDRKAEKETPELFNFDDDMKFVNEVVDIETEEDFFELYQIDKAPLFYNGSSETPKPDDSAPDNQLDVDDSSESEDSSPSNDNEEMSKGQSDIVDLTKRQPYIKEQQQKASAEQQQETNLYTRNSFESVSAVAAVALNFPAAVSGATGETLVGIVKAVTTTVASEIVETGDFENEAAPRPLVQRLGDILIEGRDAEKLIDAHGIEKVENYLEWARNRPKTGNRAGFLIRAINDPTYVLPPEFTTEARGANAIKARQRAASAGQTRAQEHAQATQQAALNAAFAEMERNWANIDEVTQDEIDDAVEIAVHAAGDSFHIEQLARAKKTLMSGGEATMWLKQQRHAVMRQWSAQEEAQVDDAAPLDLAYQEATPDEQEGIDRDALAKLGAPVGTDVRSDPRVFAAFIVCRREVIRERLRQGGADWGDEQRSGEQRKGAA